MGKINLGKVPQSGLIEHSELTRFQSPTSCKAIRTILQELSEFMENSELYKETLLHISGGVTKEELVSFKSKIDTDVIWEGLIGPWYVKPFSFLFSGYSALWKIAFTAVNVDQILTIIDKAYIGLYFVNDNLEYHLRQRVKIDRNKLTPEDHIHLDKTSFGLIIDGDSEYSKCGYFAILTIGEDCSSDLLRILKKFQLPDYQF